MYLDVSSLLSNLQAVTATAASTNVYDTANLGVGVPVTNITGIANGATAVFGEDIGGGGPLASGPIMAALVGATFTAGGAATMQVQLQAAVDNGSGGAGTWDTIAETDALPVALLTQGTYLAKFPVPTRYPGQGFPRFYRLNYVVATGPMTAGTISAWLNTGVDDIQLYPANF